MNDENRTVAYMLKDVIDINMVAVCNDICSILNIEKIDGNSKYFMVPLVDDSKAIDNILVSAIKNLLIATSAENVNKMCENDLDSYISIESLDIFLDVEYASDHVSVEKI